MDNIIGVVSCHLDGIDPLERVFQRLSTLGIGEIEWFNCTTFEAQFGKSIFQRIRALSATHKIRASYHIASGEGWDLARAAPSEVPGILKRQIEMADRLGAAKVILHFGSYPAGPHPEESREKALQKVVHALKDAVTELAHRGIYLCLENYVTHWRPNDIGERFDDFAYLFSEIDCPSVSLALDIGHANMTGNTERYLETFRDRLGHVHVHDNDETSDSHSPPGIGTVCWEAVFERLKGIGYSGTLSLEFPESSKRYPSFIDLVRKQ